MNNNTHTMRWTKVALHGTGQFCCACLWLLAGFLTPAALAEAQTAIQNPQPIQGKTLRIKRSTLLVTNMERSVAFYTGVLGLELFTIEEEYNTDPESYGYPLFNIPQGARKRMAYFNTSDEVRGFAIEEVLDFDWAVQQKPRAHAVLFETDDIAGLEKRLKAGGHQVWKPSRGDNFGLNFSELGFLDPDGHLIAAYQYFEE